MRRTRRGFIESAAAAAAGLSGWAGCAGRRLTSPATPLSGAPGVDLSLDQGGLPDYSHDLERYLVRLTADARARRKRIVEAIQTPRQIVERQKAVVAEIWKMLGGPLERTPLNPRVTGTL